MRCAADTFDEEERLAALRASNLLDTPAEPEFDRLTEMAAAACEVPVALISLVDRDRQWFKSKVGLCLTQTPRDQAFCAYTILQDGSLVIEDATLDQRTKDNPLVTGAPHVRFYAGIPLHDSSGFALGTLCVIDYRPRSLTSEHLSLLKQIARQVEAQIDLGRRTAANDRMRTAVEGARYGVRGVVCVTFLLGLLVTALLVATKQASIRREAERLFERLNSRVVDDISRRIALPTYGMKGARGVYASSKSVERAEFGAYVASRDLPREFPGALGFGFIEHVRRRDLERFVARERADDAPGFKVSPIGEQKSESDDMWIIKHIFPLKGNEAAWGLDIGSEPRRRQAAEHAARSGETTITAPIALVQDQRQRRAFLQYVPVYRNGARTNTPDERMAALTGLLYTPIVVQDALAGVTHGCERMLDYAVFDGNALTPETALAGSFKSGASDIPAEMRNRSFAITSTLTFGGRTWSVVTATTPEFDARTDHSSIIIWGVGGVALSLLASAVVWALGRSRSRAFALARCMTADLAQARDLAVKRSREATLAEQASRSTAAILQRTGAMARVGGWEMELATGRITWSDEVYRIHELPVGVAVSLDQAIGFYPPGAREQIERIVQTAIEQGQGWDVELPLVTAQGKSIWVRAQGECVREQGRVTRLCGAFQDITGRKTAEEQLRVSATHDKLTGLPNRALLNDRIQESIHHRSLRPDRTFAVLFMDFDRFKLVNDTLGHEAGDSLLKQIAGRLQDELRLENSPGRAASSCTIGRLGGDEFVVVLDELSGPEDATRVADRLLAALAAPYQILGHDVVSTASIGVVTWNSAYARPDQLLRDADIAMYEAKTTGKGRYVVFDKAMHERVQQRVAIEADLRKALEENQLSVVYQPLVDLVTGRLVGSEALLRWNHPTRGVIGPDQIIPVAEETGLIFPIGEWVIEEACRQLRQWQDEFGDRAPRSVSVNLSRKQLTMRDLPQSIERILQASGLEPCCLQIDVTENAVMKDPQIARAAVGTAA